MNTTYLIGTDIGTSGTKTVLVDLKGNIIAESLVEHDILTPAPLWAEQWPDVWLEAVEKTISDVVADSGIDKNAVKGICISGLYGGCGIPLDEHMAPVRPCIIWMDRRATAECKWVGDTIGEARLFDITGNGIDPYFGYAKILWIKNNEPENWEKIKLFLPPNQYAIYKLTGQIAMDYTSAGNLGGIYDIRCNGWSYELMDEMGIPRAMMPKNLVEPHEIAGSLTFEAAQKLGLAEGTPVCAGCVDCLASTVASGAIHDNQHTAIVSTSINWAVIHSNKPSNPAFITMPYVISPKTMYYTYGGASTAGALPKWFRDNFTSFDAPGVTYDMLNKKAEEIAAGSDGLIVLPYFMGERSPIWDVDAKGAVIGLTLHHTQAHVYRAFLESVAYSLRHIMESSQIELGGEAKLILIGGATKSSLWKQIFADVTGVPILCSSKNVEAPLGDALIAGVGTKVLNDYSVITEWINFDQGITPNQEAHEIYNRYFKKYKDIYLSLKSDMADLTKLRNH